MNIDEALRALCEKHGLSALMSASVQSGEPMPPCGGATVIRALLRVDQPSLMRSPM